MEDDFKLMIQLKPDGDWKELKGFNDDDLECINKPNDDEITDSIQKE